MWDPATQKSKGYGFVAFKDKSDAEDALRRMNGVYVGSRQIRVNWANHKTNSKVQARFSTGGTYEEIFAQSSPFNTTVYVGNLAHSVAGLFQRH
jgi:nucleolysin TIA-1/TIAR